MRRTLTRNETVGGQERGSFNLFWLILVLLFCEESHSETGTVQESVVASQLVLTVASCSQIFGGRLDIDSSCLGIVRAEEPENDVGLLVEAGEEYMISVSGKQTWFDSSRLNRAPCGECGTFMMNLFAILKKSRDSLWFSLIGEVKGENVPYDLCQNASLKATGNGKLILYANDAHGFYGNNSGEIQVKILRNKNYQ